MIYITLEDLISFLVFGVVLAVSIVALIVGPASGGLLWRPISLIL